ncbi:DUF4843 domain-containing protein [Niabella hibiscisoli]|uniref:DUF4843 domain-containing protein n=1 Tax=Niabella hibiscisoli TaxID=1825928 RepID=UPI001F113A31|nr:DUF4843 domain-containing protein [Niabella hibiscisoli]MCH5719796.1 DUF4843 domain-containing protein [Niabella hibiscisoli]
MKNIISKTYLLLLIIMLVSCKQDTLLVFDQEASGANIYFPETVTKNDTVSQLISFGYVGYSTIDSLVRIPIQTTGNPVDHDRLVAYEYDTSNTARENEHFLYERAPIIRAGRINDTILLRVKRTADMTASQFKLRYKLLANENFNVNLPGRALASGRWVPFVYYNIYMDDMAGVSYLWTTFAGRTTVALYFGAYSRKKVDLMLEVLGVSSAIFYDPKTGLQVSQLVNWSKYMAWWLKEEENKGKVYYDENGAKITMGTSAG